MKATERDTAAQERQRNDDAFLIIVTPPTDSEAERRLAKTALQFRRGEASRRCLEEAILDVMVAALDLAGEKNRGTREQKRDWCRKALEHEGGIEATMKEVRYE